MILENNVDKYNSIIQDIKETYLSKTKYPKLIVGTGLSIYYKLPGMARLAEKLEKEFIACRCVKSQTTWEKVRNDIFNKGLEEGLSKINPYGQDEREFIDRIRKITAKFILEEEIKLFDTIFNSESGFKKLIKYLESTSSNNYPVLDIMTPNYDRIIEIVCDSLKITVTSGFCGDNICSFNNVFLKNPNKFYSKDNFLVRLFKPHGSLNWLKLNGEVILTNDNMRLLKNCDDIEIITPGTSKYEKGLIDENYRVVRETFNETLEIKNYSIVIFGYGFNDEHFNAVLYSKFAYVPILIISKTIKEEIVQKALSNQNLTLFYECAGKNYLVYKKCKYDLEKNMWDIDIFANVFLG